MQHLILHLYLIAVIFNMRDLQQLCVRIHTSACSPMQITVYPKHRVTIIAPINPFTPQLFSFKCKLSQVGWCHTFYKIFLNPTGSRDDTIDEIVLRKESKSASHTFEFEEMWRENYHEGLTLTHYGVSFCVLVINKENLANNLEHQYS